MTIMNDKPYGSAIGNLMYTQVCTRPDTIFIVGVLGRYYNIYRTYRNKVYASRPTNRRIDP